MKKFALLLPIILLMSACSDVPSTPRVDDANSPIDYVGLTTLQAREKAKRDGVPFRVIKENGMSLPTTLDYVLGRINAEVVNGIVMGYEVEGNEKEPPAAYDQQSWKTLIPSSCVSFFDGCNNCRRMEGVEDAACTRMFCETYRKPECRDGKDSDDGDIDRNE